MEQYEKKGYLNSEFRLFHLTDQETKEIDYHYHDFDKITIFIRGKVNYMIEGRSYDLKPYDIVLVKQGDIHRLTVDNSCPFVLSLSWSIRLQMAAMLPSFTDRLCFWNL